MPESTKRPRAGSQPPSDALPEGGERVRLIYLLLKFEVKLFLDGMSDFVFSLLALGAVIFGLIRGGPDADQPLRDVMALGHRTEHWINLYGANLSESSADAAFAPIERKLSEHLQREGVIPSRKSSPPPADSASDVFSPTPSPPPGIPMSPKSTDVS